MREEGLASPTWPEGSQQCTRGEAHVLYDMDQLQMINMLGGNPEQTNRVDANQHWEIAVLCRNYESSRDCLVLFVASESSMVWVVNELSK